jgi:hypothetical protein
MKRTKIQSVEEALKTIEESAIISYCRIRDYYFDRKATFK